MRLGFMHRYHGAESEDPEQGKNHIIDCFTLLMFFIDITHRSCRVCVPLYSLTMLLLNSLAQLRIMQKIED